MLTGSCNCRAVTFTVKGGGDSVTACHCGQCRKQSGHHWASGYAPRAAFEIAGEVRWYALTGLHLHKHIFTRFKGDYYDIADGVPQRED